MTTTIKLARRHMEKTIFQINRMDCPSEETLVRVKLDGMAEIKHLDFDISNRKLTVFHDGQLDQIESRIAELKLDSRTIRTEKTDDTVFSDDRQSQWKVLWIVLVINFSFFVLEMTTGLISGSMGLVADSLDNLSDAFVYAISLFAVGGTLARKRNVARLAGYFQITLAVLGFIEVIRRFMGVEEIPGFLTMIIVSTLTLAANSFCLYLLQRSKSKDAHMQASTIFTSNDIVVNLGVITAGILVSLFGSNKPDLIIGMIVFVVVIRGAIKILRLGK